MGNLDGKGVEAGNVDGAQHLGEHGLRHFVLVAGRTLLILEQHQIGILGQRGEDFLPIPGCWDGLQVDVAWAAALNGCQGFRTSPAEQLSAFQQGGPLSRFFE